MRLPLLLLLLAIGLGAAEPRRDEILPTWDFAAETAPGIVPTAWQSVAIPHIFRQSGLPDNAAGWYRRTVTATPEDLAGRLWLVLDGKTTVAEVQVNGTAVGRHVSAYTAAWFDLTPALRPGPDNTLLVRISNRDEEVRDSLARSTLYYLNGGLFRSTRLVRTGAVHVHPEGGSQGVYLTPTEVTDDRATLRLRTVLAQHGTAPVTAVISQDVTDPAGHAVTTVVTPATITPGATMSVASTATIPHPQRWDLHHGRLYTVTTTVTVEGRVVDRVIERVGLRTVQVQDGKILLNGAPVLLRGVNKHAQDEDHWNAVTPDFLRAEWREMIDLGVNTVRLAHYPHDHLEYDLADQAGIAIWAENGFAGQAWAKQDPDSKEPSPIGDQITREMVLQLWNHPSILLWSAGNEAVPATASHYGKVIRGLDTSRIITYAVAQNRRPEGCDLLADNTYQGWYGGNYTEYRKGNTVISETGAGSWVTHHQDRTLLKWKVNDWEPEEYAEIFAALRLQTVTYDDAPNRPLFTWWTFREFFDHKFKNQRNTKGILTLAGAKKDLYYLFQAFWRQDIPVVRLAGRNVVLHPGGPITAYANAPSLELFIDGVSVGVRRDGEAVLPAPKGQTEGPRVRHVFTWTPDLAPGHHRLEVRDPAGNRDGFVLPVPKDGVVPLPEGGLVASLASSNAKNPASFIARPIAAQGPVFGPGDGSADTTWDVLPSALEGAHWIATGRTATEPTALTLRLRRAATVRVVLSTGTFPVITLRQPDAATAAKAAILQEALAKAGFQRETALVWRGHDLERCDAVVWRRLVAADTTLELPTFPIDAVTLLTETTP